MKIVQFNLSGSQAIYIVDSDMQISVSADLTGEEQISAVETEVARLEQKKIDDAIIKAKREKNWKDAETVLKEKNK